MVPERSPALVFAVSLLGIAIFAAMDAVMKGLVLAIGVHAALLWRSLASTGFSLVYYLSHRPAPPTPAAIRLHLIRGAVSTVMVVAFFWGLARMAMAQAVALTFIAPLLSIFLSAAILGERLRARTIAASLVAFAGVLLILLAQAGSVRHPTAIEGSLAVLASALCYAFNIVLMRQQAQLADPAEVAFSQSLIVTVLLALGIPLVGLPIPALTHLPAILLAAAFAVASLALLAWAYARAEATVLSLGEYTAFIWAALFGWLFFHEHVTWPTLAGATAIIAACVFAARE